MASIQTKQGRSGKRRAFKAPKRLLVTETDVSLQVMEPLSFGSPHVYDRASKGDAGALR